MNDHVKDLKLQILPVDAQGVDWNKIMSDAAFREPPFSPGKSEKGFRDALIVEAVGQLIASSPLDCRIAVVSSDKLMTEALVKKSIAAQNVHLLSSIEELKGLINTLVSNVDEAFIEQMKAVAASFFYEPGDRESYIYKQEITKRILRDFASLIFAIPPDQNDVERDKTLVSRPRFREKVGDRMFWVSRIAFRMKAFNESSSSVITTSTPAFGYSGFSGYSGFAGYSTINEESSTPELEALELSNAVSVGPVPPPVFRVSRVPNKIGHVAFDVSWSVVVTPQQQLREPNVEAVDYVETNWG